jgi:hypothetical protein
MTKVFLSKFVEYFDLNFYGIDIIITKDGRHLVIDCNYFSSYGGFDEALLASKFDSLFENSVSLPKE